MLVDFSVGYTVSAQAEMGLRAFREGRVAEAIVFLEYATKFQPDDHDAWLALARAFQQDKQNKKAAEAYKYVLEHAADPALGASAQEGLDSIEDRKAVGAPRSAAAKMQCPECGLDIPEIRKANPYCHCGWNNQNQGPIATHVFLADIQAYCRRRSVRVSINFRGDVIVVATSEVRIQGMGTRTYPVNPRLLFNSRDGMLIVDRSDLGTVMAKVDSDAMFRERNAGDDITIGKLFHWAPFLARLSEVRGYDVSAHNPDTSLAGVLASFNALDQDLIADAQSLQEPNETLGAAILRLGISNFEAMVSAVVGDFRIAKPNARPFHERLGSMLVAKGVINPSQLADALALQAHFRRPLGEILVTNLKICSTGDIQSVLKAQRALTVMLPEADMLGEQLVIRKKLTRTDMLQALADEQSKRRVPLGEVLINMGLIKNQDLDDVLKWQAQKKRITHSAYARLGETLINQRVITESQLAEALRAQASDHRPLGQLLIARGDASPEAVLAAIDGQIVRRNQLANAEDIDGELDAASPTSPPPARHSSPTTPLKTPTGPLKSPTGPLRSPAGAMKSPTTRGASGPVRRAPTSTLRATPGRPVKKAAPAIPWGMIAGLVALVVILAGAGGFFLLHGSGRPAAGPSALHLKK